MVTRLVLFTDRRQAHRPLDEVVNRAIDGGVRLVVLGERDLPAGRRADLADRLRVMLDGVKGRLVLAEDTTAFHKCHGLDELVAADAAGVGFATLSPIYPTRSKPGYGPPLGLAALSRMTRVVPLLPVYALGGVDTPGRVRDCLDEGATGVAVMGAVMRAEDPARFVKELMTV
ncbi:thiamine phosphate synthase [Dactylosporangium aurantiacum]|uniref:Thiamine phosphate synthase n=1 Tax=Dactylosporangium aurantiacum TaxID=35754 RepID=A0A9Q9IHF7_9ACTN|nr:thiamine phosphate synthase [Dactylosporangium aurantiacum]MDG6102506.1 thiamine phosphate synthase [Dactylosporangium aurantiacum]UWZ53218.1 thiamine phosphate synthase [Dactylosporangium aurantiacum]